MTAGEAGITATSGGRRITRESSTVGHTDVTVKFERGDGAPLWAGFHQGWMSVEGDGVEAELSTGVSSPYLRLTVTLKDGRKVYETVHMGELFEARVAAIVADPDALTERREATA